MLAPPVAEADAVASARRGRLTSVPRTRRHVPSFGRRPSPIQTSRHFAGSGEAGRIHPIRAVICVYFLLVLGGFVFAGIASLF